nr:MAG TPA: hypothetical protein [Caudoviricetes sp.]
MHIDNFLPAFDIPIMTQTLTYDLYSQKRI